LKAGEVKQMGRGREREGAPNDASEQNGAFRKTGAALSSKKLSTAMHIHSHQWQCTTSHHLLRSKS
jgi:hypothetical protein